MPHDLVVTEMMINPGDCGDNSAEYVEIFNPVVAAEAFGL